MNRYASPLLALSLVVFAALGCSGATNPVSPSKDMPTTTPTYPAVSQTHLWGYYDVYIDIPTQTVTWQLDRQAMFAANVTNFLNGSASGLKIKIDHIVGQPDYTDVDVDVSLTHPFPGMYKYNGYDVRGIFMGNGSGTLAYNTDLHPPVLGTDQVMLPDPTDGFGSPDGYTRWFNRTEFSGGGMPLFQYTPGKFASKSFAGTATLCPYRYFADGLISTGDAFKFLSTTSQHGVFSAGSQNTRNYYLRFPSSTGVTFGYAVVANWESVDVHPSNAPEALSVSTTVTDNVFYVDDTHKGGNLILDLDVFAWNSSPDSTGMMDDYKIFIESTVLKNPYAFTPSEMKPTGGGTFDTYHVEIPADNVTTDKGNSFWVIVESVGHDYTNPFGVSNLANTDPLAAAFKYDLNVLTTQANTPPIVTGIEDVQGSGHYDQVVKVGDEKSYWAIFTDPDSGQPHTFTWYVVADGATPTPADIVTFPYTWTTKGSYDIYVDVSDGTDTTQGGPYDLTVTDLGGGVITFGGTGTQYLLGFCVDHQSAKISGGYFFGDIDLDPQGGDVHQQYSTGMEMWLNKVNADGTEAWGFTWPGSMDGYHSYVWGIVCDSSDNIYVCGHFVGTIDFDPGPGVDNHTASGNSGNLDAFLMKFSSDGTYQWGESWGNCSAYVTAFDIVNYNDQFLYISGYYGNGADLDPTGGVDTYPANSDTGNNVENAYLLKVGLDGSYQWARTWGWGATLYGFDVAVDGSGNPIATGVITGTGNLAPSPGSQMYTMNGGEDTYIEKFLANGTWVWAVAFGGNSWDMINGVVADSAGNIYVNGGTCSANVDYDPGPGDETIPCAGSYDGFVSKFDSSGNFIWVDKFGGTDHDNTWDCTLDQSGNVIVGGHFNGLVDFDPGPGTQYVTAQPNSDAYVVSLTPDGALNWVNTFGGPGYSEAEKVKIAPDGMINAAGVFDQDVDFDPGSGVTTKTASGGYDTFIDWLLPSGGW